MFTMAELSSNHIAAESRASFGKGAARKLRAAGKVPAVIYGHGTAPRHISLPAHEITLLLRKANQVLELVVDGNEVLALVKDVQKDPMRQIIEHIDLLVVRRGERVTVDIPVLIEGEAAPATNVLQDANHISIEVEATHIPEHVVVNVEGLEAGAHVTAGEIVLPAGATLLSDPELLIVGISGQAGEESAEGAASEEAAAEEAAAEEAAEAE